MAADGVTEGDDESEEVDGRVGVEEVADVGRGAHAFGRGLELVGGGDGGDFLGLRDGGEDDGLLGVVIRGEVDGRGSDGSVGGRSGDVRPRWWQCGGAAAVDAAVMVSGGRGCGRI